MTPASKLVARNLLSLTCPDPDSSDLEDAVHDMKEVGNDLGRVLPSDEENVLHVRGEVDDEVFS